MCRGAEGLCCTARYIEQLQYIPEIEIGKKLFQFDTNRELIVRSQNDDTCNLPNTAILV